MSLLEDLKKERENGQALLDRCEDKALADRIESKLRILDTIILQLQQEVEGS